MLQRLRELLNPAIREISGRPLSDDEANRLTGQIINMIYAATRSQTLYIGAFGLAAQDVDRLAGDLEHLILHGLLPRPEPEAAARS
jgi:hypothetical protein